MSVSKRLCPELLPSVPLDLAFAHLAELSKSISVISVNPTRLSEWTIKITGSKVTMAELSQLGATGESLVEDSLGEEVSFTFFDTERVTNDLNGLTVLAPKSQLLEKYLCINRNTPLFTKQ